MKDNLTENFKASANTAEAEGINEVAAGPKKFKDVQALIDAYTALEAEFTRRSQRLKELEANKEEASSATPVNIEATSDNTPSQAVDSDSTQGASAPMQQAVEGVRPLTMQEKNAVIEEYLNGIHSNRTVPFVTVGGAVKTARVTPKTTSEAAALARRYFSKKEN